MDCYFNIMQHVKNKWIPLKSHSCFLSTDAPTKPTLSMDTEVREGQLITITCTVESFPLSQLILIRTSGSNPQSPEWHITQPADDWHHNALQHKFNATSTGAGFYTCSAKNSEGSETSEKRKLVVKCEWFSSALSFCLNT